MATNNASKLTVRLPPTISSAVSMTALRSASQYSRRQANSTSTDSALGSSKSVNSPLANSNKEVSKQRRPDPDGWSKASGTMNMKSQHYGYGSDEDSEADVPRTWDMIPRRPDTANSHDSLIFPKQEDRPASQNDQESKPIGQSITSKKLSFTEFAREKAFLTELPKVKPPKPPPSKVEVSSDEEVTSSSEEFSYDEEEDEEEDEGEDEGEDKREVWLEPMKGSAESPVRKTSNPVQVQVHSNALLPLRASRPPSRNHQVLSRKISRSDELVPQKSALSAVRDKKPFATEAPKSARASSSQRLSVSVPVPVPVAVSPNSTTEALHLQATISASQSPIEEPQTQTPDLEPQVNAPGKVVEEDAQAPEPKMLMTTDSYRQENAPESPIDGHQPNATPTPTPLEEQVNANATVEKERPAAQSDVVIANDSEAHVNASDSTTEEDLQSCRSRSRSRSDSIALVVLLVQTQANAAESTSTLKADRQLDSDQVQLADSSEPEKKQDANSALPIVTSAQPEQTDSDSDSDWDSEQYSEEESFAGESGQLADEQENTPDLMQKSSTESAFQVLIEPAESTAMLVSGVYTRPEECDLKRETPQKPRKSALKAVQEDVQEADGRLLMQPFRARVNVLRAQALARSQAEGKRSGNTQSVTGTWHYPESKVFDPGKAAKPRSTHATQTSRRRRNSDERIVQLLFDRIRQLSSAEIQSIRASRQTPLALPVQAQVQEPSRKPAEGLTTPRNSSYYRYKPVQLSRIPKPRPLAPLRQTKTKLAAPSKSVSSVKVTVNATQVNKQNNPKNSSPLEPTVSKRPVRLPVKAPGPRLVRRPRPIARPPVAPRSRRSWASLSRSLPHYMMPLKSKLNTEPSRAKADSPDVYPPWK